VFGFDFVVSWRDGGITHLRFGLGFILKGLHLRIWSVWRNTVPGSLEDICRIFLGWFWFGKASGIWEQACLMLFQGWLGALSSPTDPTCMQRYGKL
jgi:hypothetical protein